MPHFPLIPTPKAIQKAYEEGFQGWIWNTHVKHQWDKFCSELPTAATVLSQIKDSHKEHKRVLLYKSRTKYDPKAFEEEAQTTGDCFAAGTLVIGPNSCKKIEDTQLGDRIYAADGSITKVNLVNSKISHKPMVTINVTGGLPLTVTADHKLLVYKLPFAENTKKSRRRLSKNYCERKGADKELVATYEARRPEWINAIDLEESDYLLSPLKYANKANKPNIRILSSKEGRWLFGYMLGNGCVPNQKKGGFNHVSITLSNINTSELSERIISTFEHFGFCPKVREYKNRNAIDIRVYNKEMTSLLRTEMYDQDSVKRFPEWALNDTDVLEGLIDADGTRYEDGKIEFTSTSPSLAFGIMIGLTNLGYNPIISIQQRSKGTYKNAKPLYNIKAKKDQKKEYLWRDDEWLCHPVSSITINEGPNVVYDIGVEHKQHYFLASGYAVHNCTSHGDRNARDITRSVEIHIKGEPESYFKRGATEPTYGARGHGGQGMSPYAAAKFVRDIGFLVRQNYEGVVNLSKYNSSIGTGWGRRGVPEEIKELCRQNNVGEYIVPESLENTLDCLANGYACHSGQNWGTSGKTGKDGINSRSTGWNHDMATGGYDLTREFFKTEIVIVHNSWGAWNQPNPIWLANQDVYGPWIPGTIIVPIDEYDRYFVRSGSIYHYSNIKGFPAQVLPNWHEGDIL